MASSFFIWFLISLYWRTKTINCFKHWVELITLLHLHVRAFCHLDMGKKIPAWTYCLWKASVRASWKKSWSIIPGVPGWPRLFFPTGMAVSALLDPAGQACFACCCKLLRADSSSDVCDIVWRSRYWMQIEGASNVKGGQWFMHNGMKGLQLDNRKTVD